MTDAIIDHNSGTAVDLGQYAENAYLAYAMSVVMGRAFLCPGTELLTGKKAGKAVVTLEPDEALLPPTAISATDQGGEVVVGASSGKLLVYPLGELKQLSKGRGTQLMNLSAKDTLTLAAVYERPVSELQLVTTPSARKKLTEATLTAKELQPHRGSRARAGVALPDKAVALSCQATLGHAIHACGIPEVAAPQAQACSPDAAAGTTLSFGDEDLI